MLEWFSMHTASPESESEGALGGGRPRGELGGKRGWAAAALSRTLTDPARLPLRAWKPRAAFHVLKVSLRGGFHGKVAPDGVWSPPKPGFWRAPGSCVVFREQSSQPVSSILDRSGFTLFVGRQECEVELPERVRARTRLSRTRANLDGFTWILNGLPLPFSSRHAHRQDKTAARLTERTR